MGESRLHYGMSLRLYFEEKAFGPGMVMLLREVERTGFAAKSSKGYEYGLQQSLEDVKRGRKRMGICPYRTVRPEEKTAAVLH